MSFKTSNPTVKQSDLIAFGETLTVSIAAAIKAIMPVQPAVVPDVDDDESMHLDLRNDKDKAYERNLNTVAENVAKKGVKLVTVSGRFGAEVHSMSKMQAQELMDIQRERKAYKTKL